MFKKLREDFCRDHNKNIDEMSVEELKDTLALVHSWVKHHQGSLARYSHKYQELEKELEKSREENKKQRDVMSLKMNSIKNLERMCMYQVDNILRLSKKLGISYLLKQD